MGCGASAPVPALRAAAAEHAPEARRDALALNDEAWIELGGASLESLLAEDCNGLSPVGLLDARFLVRLAKKGAALPRRQELPREAFVGLDKLRRLGEGYGGALRIACVSAPWLTPADPDPRGEALRRLAPVLAKLASHDDGFVRAGAYGVFVDFGSIYQATAARPRSHAEGLHHARARGGVGELFAHPSTLVLQLTEFPAGYPLGYEALGHDPLGRANRAPYGERGWCFAEAHASALSKPPSMVLDVGKASPAALGAMALKELVKACAADRRPPLTPADFGAALEAKAFFCREHDLPLVRGLYERAFEEHLGAARQLNYVGLGWSDAEMGPLARVVGSGVLRQLRTLNLRLNDVGDAGMAELAAVLTRQNVPCLHYVDVEGNPGAASLRLDEQSRLSHAGEHGPVILGRSSRRLEVDG